MAESKMPQIDKEYAALRLRAAGLAEDRVARLLERAVAFFATLRELTELDDVLPEPALIWQPLEESDANGDVPC